MTSGHWVDYRKRETMPCPRCGLPARQSVNNPNFFICRCGRVTRADEEKD